MTLRIASIGCGDIAQRRHFPQLQALGDRAALVAVAARDAARLESCGERFGVAARYTDPARMLREEDIDAVLVLTPPDTHAEFAAMAVQAGKHVLVEKPLVPTLEEAVRLRAAVLAQRKVKPITFFPLPHVATAEHALVAQMVQDGAIGQVTCVENHRGHRGPTHADWFYRRRLSGGGALIDLGIYQLTAMAALFGPAVSMTASCARRFATREMDDGSIVEPDVEDIAMIALQLADGTAASVTATWNGCLPHTRTRGRVVAIGREGMLHFGVADGAVYVFRPDGNYAMLPEGATEAMFDGLPCRRLAGSGPAAAVNIVAAFADRIEAGDTSIRALDIQAHVLEMVANAYGPAEAGQPVVLKTSF